MSLGETAWVALHPILELKHATPRKPLMGRPQSADQRPRLKRTSSNQQTIHHPQTHKQRCADFRQEYSVRTQYSLSDKQQYDYSSSIQGKMCKHIVPSRPKRWACPKTQTDPLSEQTAFRTNRYYTTFKRWSSFRYGTDGKTTTPTLKGSIVASIRSRNGK